MSAILTDPLRLAEYLLPWFAKSGRHDLPWQHPATPYRVWVSEVMLQQTQVMTVIPYFERFMTRLPTLAALAETHLDTVLGLWSGLGYYARARHLHACACQVQGQYGGILPPDLAALQALPGIGRSTAAAILALAHHRPYAILDGNVRRILARYHGISGWPGQAAIGKRLWTLAEAHVPKDRPAAYTQAIMDLGATVCTRQPQCGLCPLQADCVAFATKTQDRLPTPRPRRQRPERRTHCLLLYTDDIAADKILLERRPPTGIWGGLWALPEVGDEAEARHWCRRHGLLEPPAFERLTPLKHDFTHFRLHILPLLAKIQGSGDAIMDNNRLIWYKLGETQPGGVPEPVTRLLGQLDILAQQRP